MNRSDILEEIERLRSIADRKERNSAAGKLFGFITGSGGNPVEIAEGAVLAAWCEGETVGITGDMNDWSRDDFTRIEGTPLQYYSLPLERTARLEYLLTFGHAEAGVDPLNPWRSLNGLWPTSELAGSGYSAHPAAAGFRTGVKGGHEGLERLEIASKALGYSHTVHIMRYGNPADTKATLYFQDGRDYIECAYAPRLLSRLHDLGLIPSFRAVFVTPPNLHLPAAPNRSTEYGINDRYIRFFCDELVPSIEAAFGAADVRRFVIGDSYGGLISVAIAFRRPDVFAGAFGQSGYYSFRDRELIREIESSPNRNIRLELECGLYETKVGSAFIPEQEQDFLSANRELAAVLERKGYEVGYGERAEGHTWGNWRNGLAAVLPRLMRD